MTKLHEHDHLVANLPELLIVQVAPADFQGVVVNTVERNGKGIYSVQLTLVRAQRRKSNHIALSQALLGENDIEIPQARCQPAQTHLYHRCVDLNSHVPALTLNAVVNAKC